LENEQTADQNDDRNPELDIAQDASHGLGYFRIDSGGKAPHSERLVFIHSDVR
jgi:hypothetical protein